MDKKLHATFAQSIDNLSKRQQVINSNIANIDSPHYKAKTTNFHQVMDSVANSGEQKQHIPFTKTNSKHLDLPSKNSGINSFAVQQKNNYLIQNDDNDVNLDQENVELSQTQLLFNATINAYKKETLNYKRVIDSYGKL